MNTKIVIAVVAGVVVVSGGAFIAARMSGNSTTQLAEAAGAVPPRLNQNLTSEGADSRPAIVMDERDTQPQDGVTGRDGFDRRNDRQGVQRDGGQFRSPEDMRADMLARFDKDGDGELNEEERQAAREAFRAEREARRQQFLLERYDADGDGVLSEAETKKMEEDRQRMDEERQAREAEMRQRALAAYDKDGDGRLSEEERRAANQQRREWFQQQQQQAMARFDANGDGELGQAERELMRESMAKAFEDMRFTDRYDVTGDGMVTVADMSAYLDRFYAGNMEADMNRDGVLDETDLAEFQARVAEGVNPDVQAIRDAFNSAPPPVDGEGGRGGPGGGFGGPGFFGPGGGGGPGGMGGGRRGGGGN